MEGQTMSSRSSISILAQALAEKSGLKQTDAELFIRQMFDVASSSLEADKLLKIRWLGTFKVMTVKDRESVDVNTGERIVIGGREKISFTPDSILKEIVNKPFSQFETVVVNDGVDFSEIDSKFASEGTADDSDSVGDADAVAFGENDSLEKDNTTGNTAEQSVTANSSIDFTVIDEQDDHHVSDYVPTPDTRHVVDYATDEVIVLSGSVESGTNDGKNSDTSTAANGPVVEDANESGLSSEYSVQSGQTEQQIHSESVENQTQSSDVLPLQDTSTDETIGASSEQPTVGVTACVSGPHQQENGTTNVISPVDDTVVDDTETDMDETADSSTDSGHYFRLPRWVIPLSAAVLVGLLIGIGWICFNYGQLKTERNLLAIQLKDYKTARQRPVAKKPRDIQAEEIRRKSQEDSVRMAQASKAVAQAEKAEMKEANAEEKDKQATSSPTKAGGKDVSKKQTENGQVADKPESTSKTAATPEKDKSVTSAKYDTDPRVRTGAYRIIGVAKTVEVKQGQTLQSLSRLYLGEGMECYVEAINGIRSVKPGQKLKIPQLQLKKKTAKKG